MGQAVVAATVIQRGGNGPQPAQHRLQRKTVPTLLDQQLLQAVAVLVIHVFHLNERPAVSAMPPPIRTGDMRMVQFQSQIHARLDSGQIIAQVDYIGSLRPLVALDFPSTGYAGQENLDRPKLL